MFETRSASATSATVTKRARPSNGCATVDHPSLRGDEGKPAVLLVLLGIGEPFFSDSGTHTVRKSEKNGLVRLTELPRALGRRLHGLEQRRPHRSALEGQQAGGGGAAGRRHRR